jgi:phage shock protein PspC (stress-responsive transcriptional regulator)
MQRVIAVNLNGNAYQVEEQGYDALLAYLARAESALETNPDKPEVLADLEQAIAEKCQRFLGPNKTVIAAAEMDRILTEMGPVETGTAAASEDGATQEEKTAEEKKKSADAAPKRLYQIREGAMLSGVCNGLAAYLNLDVTLVRVAFVILALLTKGVWILVYAVLSFVIPYAKTSEERAAAHGRPFTAKELIDQARTNFASSKDLKRQWRRQRRVLRQQMRGMAYQHQWAPAEAPQQVTDAAHVWSGLTAPFFGLVNAGLFLLFVVAVVSIFSSDELFGYPLPPGIPAWGWFLMLFVFYQFIASPLKAASRAASHPYGPPPVVIFGPFVGLLWIAAVLLALWWGYNHVPEVQAFIERIPDIWNRLVPSNR